MRTRRLTPCEVASCIRSIPERADCPPARCRTLPHVVVVRWWLGDPYRSVAVVHDCTGTFVEIRHAGAGRALHAVPPGALVPFVRQAIDWLLDGGDRGVPP